MLRILVQSDLRSAPYRPMKNANLVTRLQRIADLFLLGPPPADGERYDVYDLTSEHPLSLIGDKRQLFRTEVDELLESMKEVRNTICRETAISELLHLVRSTKVNGTSIESDDADQFKGFLLGSQVQTFLVARPIYGLDVAADRTPVKFGDFSIDFGRNIILQHQKNAMSNTTFSKMDEKQLFILCSVPARDSLLVNEIADRLFYKFEMLFRFLIGRRTEWVQVGILSFAKAELRYRFTFAEDGSPVGHGSEWQGPMQPFILRDERFPQPSAAMEKLFGLITREKCELEGRILRCAEWTGQAIAEPNEAAALVKAAIALEVLLSLTEKGVITPSIMAQISESCAFLLAGSSMPPLEIERAVKRLYGERSAVVHSGRAAVAEKDLEQFIDICRRSVLRLLSGEEYSEMRDLTTLSDHFKAKKYESIKRVAESQVHTP